MKKLQNSQKKGIFFKIFIASILLLIGVKVYSIEFFEVGVNADVNTTIKLDPKLEELIKNLPSTVRVEFSKAANQILNELDKTVIDGLNSAQIMVDGSLRHADASIDVAINKVSKELNALALKSSRDMECSAKNVINDVFDEVRSLLPWYKKSGIGFLADKCEKLVSPDQAGLSPNEKYTIAECRILDVLSKEKKVSVVVSKLGKLEWISKNATCLMRDTQYENKQRKKQIEYANLSKAYIDIELFCKEIDNCLVAFEDEISKLIDNVGQNSERSKLKNKLSDLEINKIKKANCLFPCQKKHLLKMSAIERDTRRTIRKAKYEKARQPYESALQGIKKVSDSIVSLQKDAKIFSEAKAVIEMVIAHSDTLNKAKEDLSLVNKIWPGYDQNVPIIFSGIKTELQKLSLIDKTAKHTLTNVGPLKKYRELKAGIYRTDSYWGGGGHAITWCLDTINVSTLSGLTIVGAEHIKTWDKNDLRGIQAIIQNHKNVLGCRPPGHCDGAGESCASHVRNPGCLVSSKWLRWYKSQHEIRKSKESRNEICTGKQSPWN